LHRRVVRARARPMRSLNRQRSKAARSRAFATVEPVSAI
jgi:hypothetical protein